MRSERLIHSAEFKITDAKNFNRRVCVIMGINYYPTMTVFGLEAVKFSPKIQCVDSVLYFGSGNHFSFSLCFVLEVLFQFLVFML